MEAMKFMIELPISTISLLTTTNDIPFSAKKISNPNYLTSEIVTTITFTNTTFSHVLN